MSEKKQNLFCFKCGYSGWYPIHFCGHCHETHHFVSLKEYERAKKEHTTEPPIPEGWDGDQYSSESLDNSSDIAIPFVRNDHMKKHMDWSLGTEISSKSHRDALDKANGMIRVSPQEEYRDKDKPVVKGRAVTYAGQKTHTSSSERGGVRTKEGQRII